MQRSIINFSVPKSVEEEISLIAKKENRTKSEILREAFRVYQFRKNWAKLRIWGADIALKMGIESYDDVEKVAG